MFATTDREMLTCADVNAEVGRDLDDARDAGLLSAGVSDEIQRILAAFYAAVSVDGPRRDEAYWRGFQALFGFAQVDPGRRVIPMNAANLCPEPTALLRASNLLRLEYNENVAQQLRTRGGVRVGQLEATRRSLAALLGLTDADSLAIVRNASEGNSAINNGHRGWRSGENVVLWGGNHPTNNAAWALRQASEPFAIRRVTLQPTDTPEQVARKFIAEIDDQTRFVSYSLISNINGIRVPDSAVAKIWDHARTRANCHVHIDGTMALGALPINLGDPHCHSFTSSAHKWFLGPKETAILYMASERAPKFVPNIYAYDYKIHFHDLREIPRSALRFELIGQRDDANIIALHWTALMWQLLQAKRPYQRVTELADYIITQLAKPAGRWELLTPGPQEQRAGVLWIKAPQGRRSATLYKAIYDRQDARIAASGDDALFRVCPHIYNTQSDIDRLVSGMNAWYEQR